MLRGDTPMFREQHESFTSRIASSNYQRLDVESAFSQHSEINNNEFKRAVLDQETLSQATQDEDRSAAESGVIEKIILQNFMCHGYFELDLGPQLNFIIGRNGSGKSAILTSISVGLGCKANETDRGKNLKDLIKRGTNTAKITIIFKNKGEYAFEHEKYGDKIIVERVLRNDGVSGYFLKSENKKTVSTKKVDLDTMLESFGITINNPLAFLSQGAAKTFLAASTDEDKYSFFMKGIQMEQTINEYMHSNSQLSKIHQEIDLRSANIHALRDDAEKAKQVYKTFHESKNLRENKKTLSGKLIWLQIVTKEADVQTLKFKKNQLLQQIAHSEEQIQNQRQLCSQIEDEIVEVKKEADVKQGSFEEINNQRQEYKAKLKSFDSKISDLQSRIDDSTSSNRQKRRQIGSYEQKINLEMKRLNSLNGGSKDSLRDKIAELQRTKVDQYEPRQRELAKEIFDKDEVLKKRYIDFKNENTEKQGEVEQLRKHRQQLINYESDKLAPYGDNMKHVIEAINNDNGFRQKPLGPLGLYTSLKTGYEKWQPILESTLNNLLSAFVVQNHHDHKRLVSIFKRFRLHNQIITRKFEKFKYNSKFRDAGLTRIVDVLNFDNEDVELTFIDIQHIENSILEEDSDEARKIVENVGGLKFCFSLFDNRSGKRFQVSPFNGAFKLDPVFYNDIGVPRLKSSDKAVSSKSSIAKIDLKIQEKKLEVQELEKEFQRDKSRQRQVIDSLKSELSKIKKNIGLVEREVDKLEAKLDQDEGSSKLESYMEEKSNIENEIAINDNTIAGTQAELEDLNQKFEKSKLEYNMFQDKISAMQRELNVSNSKIQQLEDRKAVILENIESQNSVQRKKRAIINTIEERIPLMEQQIEREIPNAEKWCTREIADIDLERDETNEIKRQIQIINQQLSEVNKSIGMTEEQVIKEHNEKTEVYKNAREELLKAHALRDKLTKSIFNRMTAGKTQREMLCLAADSDFSSSLHLRGFEGKLLFNFEKKKLQMLVGKDGKPPREVTSLSGGEKSFTQIALLLAIWKPMRSKIRGLDEFDVFMDTVNRRISMSLMLESLRKEPKSQTIFITPQDIGHVRGIDAPDVNIHKLKDPARKNNSTNN